VGGEATDRFDAVGAFVASQGDLWGTFCSGTLIADSQVLTAAHCVDAMVDYNRAGYNISFATGSDLYDENAVESITTVSSAITHPDYAYDPVLRSDIAMARLAEMPGGVDPLPLNDIGPGQRDWSFDTLTHVGWGALEVEGSGAGVKRMVDLELADYDDDFVYTWDSEGSNVCVGDSGGPALGKRSDGKWAIAGVIAFVFDPEGGEPVCEGGAAGSTRVDAHSDFIEEVLAMDAPDETLGWSNFELDGSAGNGNLADDASKAGCAVVSAGSVLGGWSVGAVAVLARRRKWSGHGVRSSSWLAGCGERWHIRRHSGPGTSRLGQN